MTFSNLQKLFRGAGWLTPSLLPLLQGALRYTQRRGKLGLREPTLQPHANNVRLGFNLCLLSAAGFDFAYAVQDILPHIALHLEVGECFAGQVLYIYLLATGVNPSNDWRYVSTMTRAN
jgi:hypothetical protein